jgi:selenocysteine lyase/cysteine desulfurase
MTTTAERLSCVDVDAVSELLPVVGGNTTVPLVDGTQRVYANLDYAASAPALEAVAARVTEVLPLYASVHRGAGYLSQVSTALYESARQTVARFVDARPDDVAIITRNTTDSLNLLARVVPSGSRQARGSTTAGVPPERVGGPS